MPSSLQGGPKSNTPFSYDYIMSCDLIKLQNTIFAVRTIFLIFACTLNVLNYLKTCSNFFHKLSVFHTQMQTKQCSSLVILTIVTKLSL